MKKKPYENRIGFFFFFFFSLSSIMTLSMRHADYYSEQNFWILEKKKEKMKKKPYKNRIGFFFFFFFPFHLSWHYPWGMQITIQNKIFEFLEKQNEEKDKRRSLGGRLSSRLIFKKCLTEWE